MKMKYSIQTVFFATSSLLYTSNNILSVTGFTPCHHQNIPTRFNNIQTFSLSSSSLSLSSSASSASTTTSDDDQNTLDFKARTKQLCNERNLKLEKVKNARDLASVKHSPIKPGRIIRTGRVSDATQQDLELLNDQIQVKTLVDLRSMTELKDDPTLDRDQVFRDYTDLVWIERNQHIKVLNEGQSRVLKKKKIAAHVKDLVNGAKKGVDVATHLRNNTDTATNDEDDAIVSSSSAVDADLIKILSAAADLAEETSACEDCDDNDESTVVQADVTDLHEDDEELDEKNPRIKRFTKVYHSTDELIQDKSRKDDKERHFVAVMNEMKYVRGTLSKVRKRDLAKVIIKSPGAIVSKRVRSSCKDVFLNKINQGGLHMMNSLLLKYGAPGIKYVLDLCKDRSRHPIAFYCTAGKDRTGMIAAIMLAAAGVPDEDIVEDYSLSANVYAEMNDHKAMVGALSQRNLDAKTFLGAPPEVMREALVNIRATYGSIEEYLDFIGFTEEDRKELRAALLDD